MIKVESMIILCESNVLITIDHVRCCEKIYNFFFYISNIVEKTYDLPYEQLYKLFYFGFGKGQLRRGLIQKMEGIEYFVPTRQILLLFGTM